MAHIYKITNTVTGKIYIGQTQTLPRRISSHKNALRGSRHRNTPLQADWNTHGEEAFTFEELLICSPENMNLYESRAIKVYGCLHPKGYNLTSGGSSSCEVSLLTRNRISEANRGRIRSPEVRKKMSERMKGQTPRLGAVLSPETRTKIANSRKGWAHSPESKVKMSEASKGHTRGLGRVMPQATRDKIGESRRGRIHSPETRAKMSEALKGKGLGRVGSPESKAKRKATWAAKSSPI